jgi:YrbI family 3-deoxy-D-manno-octulosonate 8-phosphate phosphatase
VDGVVKAPREVLAVVQARGGSKGLPGKNVRRLAGHPLIAYSIAAARSSARVTRVIVSTDDEHIAEVARQYGAEVPFLRPVELAQDLTPDLPLFEHALAWLRAEQSYTPDLVVQLRPTSPFRPPGLIDDAVDHIAAVPDADCVRTVTVPHETPFKMWRVGQAGFLKPLLESDVPEPYNAPRQSLPPVRWQTGHLDVFRGDLIKRRRSLTGDRVLPLEIDRRFCVDIDTQHDWLYAEWLLEREELPIVWPGSSTPRRPLPSPVQLLVLDFDGVMTDDRVLTMQDGTEGVLCSRGDGLGLALLAARGVPAMVVSKERNPVVAARCRKLGVECFQGVDDKAAALRDMASGRGVSLAQIVYAGNDVNDLECLRLAGCGVAVADAHPAVIRAADRVLTKGGGCGAVRELCDLILAGLPAADI